MLVRWTYKLQPNKEQSALMSEWLVTLRKHRNYMLAERKRGFETNNQDADQAVMYGYGAYCELDTRLEVYSSCPLTCPVLKHGVMSAKTLVKGNGDWLNVSGVQGARTTELRGENPFYSRIASDVLNQNRVKLETAYSKFFKKETGFPAFRKASNFNSFQFPGGKYKIEVNRNSKKKRCYSHVYFPSIGRMRYLDSRPLPLDAEPRTVTVMKEADGWYVSILLKLNDELPALIENPASTVGIDMGINRLVSLSDGSFVENPRFGTNPKTRRQLRIRQRRVNRKVKGSSNRKKAGIVVARLHKTIADKRSNYQWKAARQIVKTADVVVREDLNVVAMKSRCKTKKLNGRFMKNGQSAKRGLNRSIADAAWSELTKKIEWLAAKSGKAVVAVDPKYTSQECSKCGHKSRLNRKGEKFVCENCGHLDHADTQAARTIGKRASFTFKKNVRKDVKILPVDSGKVTIVRYDSALTGKRNQGNNGTSKARRKKQPENPNLVQLELFSSN